MRRPPFGIEVYGVQTIVCVAEPQASWKITNDLLNIECPAGTGRT